MQSLMPLLTIAGLWTVAAVTPGPNFLLTIRLAAARSRVAGLAAVAGIGVATAVWGLAGLLGVHALFAAAPWLYWALKTAGAAYLVVLGLTMLANSRRRDVAPVAAQPARGVRAGAAFRLGLVTSLANPKSALSVASMFAAALPAQPSMLLGACAIVLMVAISTLWYAGLAYVFTLGVMTAGYARLRHWLDRAAGALFVALGMRLALDRA